MCYDKSLTKSQQDLENYYGYQEHVFDPPFVYESYYHVKGFDKPIIYIIPQQDPFKILPATWGLVPKVKEFYEDGKEKKYDYLNTKSENLFKVKAWEASIRHYRCLIFCDGFFEPHHRGELTFPYYCYIPEGTDRKLFCFAGIYTEHEDEVYTASIITTEANEFFSQVHNKRNRMPFVFDEIYQWEWLKEDLTDEMIKDILKEGFTKDEFAKYTVSKDLYQPTNTNLPGILDKVVYRDLFGEL